MPRVGQRPSESGVRMPFGRYRGEYLEDVPTEYLHWLLSIDLQPWLREAVEFVLGVPRGRSGSAEDGEDDGPDRPKAEASYDVVKRWYREMMMKYHPDRGGSNEVAAALTDAKDRLLEMIEDAQGR